MTLTYNFPDKHLGSVTYGGYSDSIVVDEWFVLQVLSNLNLAGAAPLLCAGITTYSPMRHWSVDKGKKVGVVGLGGLGHMR
jgi:alcohol dehydrogenase (NADP+)